MFFNEDHNHSTYQIRSYEPGIIKVNAENYTFPFILTPEKIINDILPETLGALNCEHINTLCQLGADIILLGTGEKQVLLKKEWMIEAAKFNLTIDVMDTHAACRTYTVLSSEGRQLVAALFP